MHAVTYFSPDYATARQRFRQAVSRLGWDLEAHPIDAAGPEGEELTTDVAISPGGDSQKTLVLSSGLHGVEGFFGSAVQVGLLEQWASATPPAVKSVFLHALNPFGFAWLRRFDENNVDPNRNFLLAGEPYAGAPPAYAALDPLLNPRRPPSRWEPFTVKALLKVARHGMIPLRHAIAAGQYEFPQGLFFGGTGPSAAHRLLAEHLGRWLQGSRSVVHLDFHTGLGPKGTSQLLFDYPLSAHQRQRLTDWFGAESFEAGHSRNIAYAPRGGFGRWCTSRELASDYLYACAEFGTYGPIRVLAGLRAENQAHYWGSPAAPSTRRAKQRLKELFCPTSEAWRSQVLHKSFQLVTQALQALEGPPPKH